MKLSTVLLSLNKSTKSWRDAASIILVAPVEKNGQQSLGYLVMKRSTGSKFMPGGLVFPGGTVSESDSSPHWISLYKKAGIRLKDLNLMAKEAHRPTIYTDYNKNSNNSSDEVFAPEVAFRLTALRETFEECGILLTKTHVGNPPQLQDEDQVLKWQSKVKKNPEEFLHLCEEMSVVPNLDVLSEWSNWLTPIRFPIRFDTVFYIACLPRPLPVVLDKFEAQSAQWSTAQEFLDGHNSGSHRIMPPQFYELHRMKSINSIEEMLKLGESRRLLGFERWLPAQAQTKDGFLSLLPGDDLYPEPEDDESKEKIKYDLSNDELLNSCQRYHRLHLTLHRDQSEITRIAINCDTRFGQVYPPET